MFKTLKEEGNQCVKDKNYKDALSKYSECLKIPNKFERLFIIYNKLVIYCCKAKFPEYIDF